MKKSYYFVFISLFFLITACDNTTEIMGTIEYEVPLTGYLPDAGAEIYATQENVDAIKELIISTDKNVFLWGMKEVSEWNESKYAEFEGRAGITSEEYSVAYTNGLEKIMDLMAPALKNKNVVKTTANASGHYSLKLKNGNSWNIVYISKNLNPEDGFFYVDVKSFVELNGDKRRVDVKFDKYKFEFFR